MRIFIFLILFTTYQLFAIINIETTKLEESPWPRGETLLTYFEKKGIPQHLYYDLSETDKELCAEIAAETKFQQLIDTSGKLKHALIPISEEMQIHISQTSDNEYKLDFVSIETMSIEQTIVMPISSSPYQDILSNTGNKALANEFIRAFNKSVSFNRLQVGDLVAIKYKHKIRMGHFFGTPEVDVAMIKSKAKANYVFKNDIDGRYYDEKARSLNTFFMRTPLQYKRISSPFDLKRFHPVLKIYRPHLGVDYAAPTGRQINAAADGKITFVGTKGGYGKTIEIQHKNGYKTLYAHLNGYAKNTKSGRNIKQGDLIAYVGSTGLSSGPHLHFGVYLHGRAVDPLKVINSSRQELPSKEKQIFLKKANILKQEIENATKLESKPYRIEAFEHSSNLNT
jgi:murein DD-endopeptidase MepM/ murein hydrolase activator NlpD